MIIFSIPIIICRPKRGWTAGRTAIGSWHERRLTHDVPVNSKQSWRFEAGFIAGVKAVNPDAEVIVDYTGAFDAPDQGKASAATLFNNGADILFHAAGATGDGVFNEGGERRKAGNDVWVIGVDKDQSVTFGHEITLTSMMKRVDQAVAKISADLVNGRFTPGTVELGLAESGVGLPENNPNVPEDVLNKVKEFEQKIISGEIAVPFE